VVANGSENIEHLPLDPRRMRYAVRREQRQAQFSRDLHRRLISRLLFAVKVPLQFDVHILAPKNRDEFPHTLHPAGDASSLERVLERPFFSAGEANEAGHMLRHFFRRDAAFIFRCAQLHASDQAAEVLISRLRFNEDRIAISAGGRDFGADVRANFIFQCGVMKARRSI
jgi:hypothetical protein